METVRKSKTNRPVTKALRHIGEREVLERWRKKRRLGSMPLPLECFAAANGNPEAARAIHEAIEGKVPLRIALAGDGGDSLLVTDLAKKICVGSYPDWSR
jgi:hypothetical protein